MKKIILVATLCLVFMITACNNFVKYKHKYVLDMSNQAELITFSTRLSEDKSKYVIKLLYKFDEIEFEDFEINFEIKADGAFSSITYKGTINSQSPNLSTTIEVSPFNNRYYEPVVTTAKGYILSNTEFSNYVSVSELDEKTQSKLREELIKKLTFENQQQMTMTMDMSVKVNGTTQKVKQEIAIDLENNYLHSITDGNSGVVLIQDDDSFVLYNYSRYLMKDYLSALEKINIESITDYKDYQEIDFEIEDTFIIIKKDDKYLLETTFRKFLVANNQSELVSQLGNYADHKIVIELSMTNQGFKMYVQLKIENVLVTMYMNYQFGEIKKIDFEKAIILGDSNKTNNNQILDPNVEMKNQLIASYKSLYYRYQLEEGDYFFNAATKGDEDLHISIYNANTGKQIDLNKPDSYFNLSADNLYHLPKGDYLIGVYNGNSSTIQYDFKVENILDYQTTFNVNEPDFINPVGDITLNFESSVDPIAVKFTANPKKTIRITYTEDVYRYPKTFENNWFRTLSYYSETKQSFDVYIEKDTILVFENDKKGTKNINISVLAEVLDEPLDLQQNSSLYMIADNNTIYTLEVLEDSYISLKLHYLNLNYNNPFTLILLKTQGDGEEKIIETLRRNQVVEIFIAKGSYDITTFSNKPFRVEVVSIRTSEV